jgi:hypothetical protein
MKTYRIDAMQKGKQLPADRPNYPADFSDYFDAENEEQARAKWEAENQEFTGGSLEIVRVRVVTS